ncbi:MAG TPA: hypothetical protein VNT01_08755 [Symbiobacteriaceae bacterium]|nr:hypothetical protein [Symbiobacteriaceae bacterium]
MRKLYVIRENEEDGRLLDALTAAGCSTDESEFDNPVCPVCGHSTLLAYTEGDAFEVVTWYCLDEADCANADGWYLVCSQMECTYEERVERVTDPMGALLFDIDMAHWAFDEYAGLISRHNSGMMELITWLRGALESGPNRKLQCFLEEAEWRYADDLQRTRKWIDRVPPGRLVRFQVDGASEEQDEIMGTFLTGTDAGFMVLTEPGGALMSLRSEDVFCLQPRRPDKDELSRPLEEELKEAEIQAGQTPKRNWIKLNTLKEMVVIRGHHVRLGHVDMFGRYHVRCWERSAALALGLQERCENYWEGVFRRSDVEIRYDVRHMVKVKGHWVDVYGAAEHEDWPAVRTTDPMVASELGLKLERPWFPPEDEAEERKLRPCWSGVIPEDDVEDRREVRLYHWPLPEFPLPDAL